MQNIGNGSIAMHCKNDETTPSWISIPEDLVLNPIEDHMHVVVDNIYDDFHLNYDNGDIYHNVLLCAPSIMLQMN